jgi:hypothetical protein
MDFRGIRKKFSFQYLLGSGKIFPYICADRKIKIGKVRVFKEIQSPQKQAGKDQKKK